MKNETDTCAIACDYQLDGVEMVKLDFCAAGKLDFKNYLFCFFKEKKSFLQKKNFKTLKHIFKERIIQDLSLIKTNKNGTSCIMSKQSQNPRRLIRLPQSHGKCPKTEDSYRY